MPTTQGTESHQKRIGVRKEGPETDRCARGTNRGVQSTSQQSTGNGSPQSDPHPDLRLPPLPPPRLPRPAAAPAAGPDPSAPESTDASSQLPSSHHSHSISPAMINDNLGSTTASPTSSGDIAPTPGTSDPTATTPTPSRRPPSTPPTPRCCCCCPPSTPPTSPASPRYPLLSHPPAQRTPPFVCARRLVVPDRCAVPLLRSHSLRVRRVEEASYEIRCNRGVTWFL